MSHFSVRGEASTNAEIAALTGLNNLAISAAGEFIQKTGVATFANATPAEVGLGTVTSVSIATANGVSGTVTNPTTTPSISLTLGVIIPTTVNGLTISTTTGTFTLTNAKTLTVSDSTTLATNAITFAGGEVVTFSATNAITFLTTGVTSITLPTSGTLVSSVTTGNGVSATNTAGALAFTLGVITPTSVNGLIVTTTAGTLTIANNASASLITSGNFGLTLTATNTTNSTFPAGTHTLSGLDVSETVTGVKTMSSIIFPDQGQLKLTVPTTDLKATGFTNGDFNSGYSSSAIGDLVYLDSSSTWQKCDANTLLLYNGLLGIALEVKASGNALLVALPGSFVYSTTGFPTWTIGGPIYMSETPGAMTQTAPVTTDSATRVVGWGVHADKMYFFPSPDYTTHT